MEAFESQAFANQWLVGFVIWRRKRFQIRAPWPWLNRVAIHLGFNQRLHQVAEKLSTAFALRVGDLRAEIVGEEKDGKAKDYENRWVLIHG